MATTLAGKVAVVTGSTRGIGRAIAKLFASEGAAVVVNSRSPLTAEIAKELGPEALGVVADLSSAAGVNDLFSAVESHFNRIDILINNAGMSMVRESRNITLSEWQATLNLNLTAPLLCSQRATRLMGEKGGSIVNIASLTSFAAFPGRVAYGVSKAGLVMMTRILASEWAPQVRVNAVAPGFIETEEIDALVSSGALDIDAIRRRTPQKRLGSPSDVATACLFLASDSAGFITGETLVADGGWLAYGYT